MKITILTTLIIVIWSHCEIDGSIFIQSCATIATQLVHFVSIATCHVSCNFRTNVLCWSQFGKPLCLSLWDSQSSVNNKATNSIAKKVLLIAMVYNLLIKRLHYQLEHERYWSQIANLSGVIITCRFVNLIIQAAADWQSKHNESFTFGVVNLVFNICFSFVKI